jgi:hypothetical protein
MISPYLFLLNCQYFSLTPFFRSLSAAKLAFFTLTHQSNPLKQNPVLLNTYKILKTLLLFKQRFTSTRYPKLYPVILTAQRQDTAVQFGL